MRNILRGNLILGKDQKPKRGAQNTLSVPKTSQFTWMSSHCNCSINTQYNQDTVHRKCHIRSNEKSCGGWKGKWWVHSTGKHVKWQQSVEMTPYEWLHNSVDNSCWITKQQQGSLERTTEQHTVAARTSNRSCEANGYSSCHNQMEVKTYIIRKLWRMFSKMIYSVQEV